jgi:2-polyprenyl-3-methyl-5-hydroxy-6-metoxy-1,4-benzoquinol methylase
MSKGNSMIEKPDLFSTTNAASFQEFSVAAAYRHRPPYPAAVFDILTRLITAEPQRVLDVGCGTGNLARYLVTHVDWVDAVDFSSAMIEQGKTLPNGDHPRLRWLHGRVEEVVLDPPYALVTAGESLHWMDLQVVLPRFHQVLTAGGYLAIARTNPAPDPWSMLGEIIHRYRTDGGYQPYDMITALEQRGLFQKVGEEETAPVQWVQSIDEYIEGYHSRSGFSKERLGPERTAAFDQEARRLLLCSYPDGSIPLRVSGHIVWGLPQGQC